MTAAEQFLADIRTAINNALDSVVPAGSVAPARLHDAIRWSLFAGGKRIRPAITIACGRIFGAPDNSLIKTGAAIEMVHTYSLIHDDLPAMDDDELRRGRPTCHVRFGEATAILAGDVLQTLAFQTISEDENISADTRIRLIATIAAAAGTPLGMVAGQQMDLDAEGTKQTLDAIEQIHRRKTGALITASAAAGAIIGGADENELAAIENYGAGLGLLFQITDDLLDVTGATETLGKTAGKDAAVEKATYPGMLGLSAARGAAADAHRASISSLTGIDRDTELLISLADMILERKK